MPLLFDDRDWCDVDSDEDYSIPELPPLPPDEMSCETPVVETPVVKEEVLEYQRVVTPINAQRFQFNFNKGSSPENRSDKQTGYVCFVGKFPSATNILDLKNFVKSNGISFTDVRMGPKKNPNVNVFGYVDVPTRKDYNLLLSLDGTLYRDRAIRVDHATRKEKSSKTLRKKKARTKKEDKKSNLRKAKPYNQPAMMKDLPSKKSSSQFQRFSSFRNRKTSTRKKQKYRKEKQNSGVKKKSYRKRFEVLKELA